MSRSGAAMARVYRVGPCRITIPVRFEITDFIDEEGLQALRVKGNPYVYFDFSATRMPPGTPEDFLANGRHRLPVCETIPVDRRYRSLRFQGERHHRGQFGPRGYADFLWTTSGEYLIGISSMVLAPPVDDAELAKVVDELPETFLSIAHDAIVAGGGQN